MEYRREIDGLRAIAVLPVMLFHAGIGAFGGGFVGVDVFFVISGYLITKIILNDLARGKFSIIDFYERRARRILPALFLVMLVSIPFAWLFLTAPEYKSFSRSLIAVSIFASNVLFYRESGYFDTTAELKPLLHTWSLAVEEQYYLVFPIILMFIWKRARRWLFVSLLTGAVASLAFAQWAVYTKPAAAFYLLPTRGWELLVGALAAVYLSQTSRQGFGRTAGEVGGWLGVILIFYAVFSYSKATPFPGYYALVPTLATVLIIVFATENNTVGRFIGNRAFVALGLISYSAYLWHQPLFAFARHGGVEEPDRHLFIVLLVIALALAFFTWKFVEGPFRSQGIIKRALFLKIVIVGGLFFIGFGYYGRANEGFPENTIIPDSGQAKLTDRNFVVLGDSHGEHLISGLVSITTGRVENFTSVGCIPFRNVDRYDSRFAPGECARTINSWLDKIIKDDPGAVIILSAMGPLYLDAVPFKGKDVARVTGLGVELITDKSITDRYKVFEIGLRQTLSELSSLRKSNVIFAIDVPELGIDSGCSKGSKKLSIGKFVLRDLVPAADAQNCVVPRQEYEDRAVSYKKLVSDVVAEFPATLVFDPTDSFCDSRFCRGYDPRYGFLYRDVDHLSASGSRFYAERLADFIYRK